MKDSWPKYKVLGQNKEVLCQNKEFLAKMKEILSDDSNESDHMPGKPGIYRVIHKGYDCKDDLDWTQDNPKDKFCYS